MDTIQTANFEIGFHEPEDNDNQYGWFEHNEYGGVRHFGSKVKSLSIMTA
jgi:hypothetical protein